MALLIEDCQTVTSREKAIKETVFTTIQQHFPLLENEIPSIITFFLIQGKGGSFKNLKLFFHKAPLSEEAAFLEWMVKRGVLVREHALICSTCTHRKVAVSNWFPESIFESEPSSIYRKTNYFCRECDNELGWYHLSHLDLLPKDTRYKVI